MHMDLRADTKGNSANFCDNLGNDKQTFYTIIIECQFSVHVDVNVRVSTVRN
jgi:hypothetical protein